MAFTNNFLSQQRRLALFLHPELISFSLLLFVAFEQCIVEVDGDERKYTDHAYNDLLGMTVCQIIPEQTSKMSGRAAAPRRSGRDVPRPDYTETKIIESGTIKKSRTRGRRGGRRGGGRGGERIHAPAPAAVDLDMLLPQFLRTIGDNIIQLPPELRMMVYERIRTSVQRDTIPGFPSGSYSAYNMNHPRFRTPAYPDVEIVLDRLERLGNESAQIVMDFEQIRQLPRLLSMIEEGVRLERLFQRMHHDHLDPTDLNYATETVDVAVASFFDPATHREIWLRLHDDRATPPPLIQRHRIEFQNLADAAARRTPIAPHPDEVHSLCRFLRIMLERIRRTPSSSHPSLPFTPGDLEVVLEIPRNEFPFPDPTNPSGIQTFHVWDAVRYLHRFTQTFEDQLRLSFTIRPSMTAPLPDDLPPPPAVRATVTATTLSRFQEYKQRYHNDHNFRLTIDDTLL
jgi:hypothetical protein